MNLKHIGKTFSVTTQLYPADIEEAKASGFRTIICNRPDGEAADQPAFEQIAEAASAAGLATYYFPVESGVQPLADGVDQFRALIDSAPQPVLAYCRSGTRSAMLFMLVSRKPA